MLGEDNRSGPGPQDQRRFCVFQLLFKKFAETGGELNAVGSASQHWTVCNVRWKFAANQDCIWQLERAMESLVMH